MAEHQRPDAPAHLAPPDPSRHGRAATWPGRLGHQRAHAPPRRRPAARARLSRWPRRPGVGGGYQLEAGATLPPLLLDDEEAIAIAVALRSTAGGGIDGIEETSVRALTKVVRTMPPRLRARVDTLAGGDRHPVARWRRPDGVGGGHRDPRPGLPGPRAPALRVHDRDRDRGSATRLVEPDRLVTLGRRWYLIAWDIDRADWRTFRVDRLRDPRSTRYRFEPRELPGGDPIAFVRAQIDQIPTRYQVAIRIDAPATTLERSFGRWVDIEADGAASARSCASASTRSTGRS